MLQMNIKIKLKMNKHEMNLIGNNWKNKLPQMLNNQLCKPICSTPQLNKQIKIQHNKRLKPTKLMLISKKKIRKEFRLKQI